MALGAALSLVACGAAGCGDDTTASAADLSAAPTDAGATSLGVTVNGVRKPLTAWYSFYVQPLNDDGPPGTYLVVSAIDPAFDCDKPIAGLDAIEFFFDQRGAGAVSKMVSGRSGPDFVGTVGGKGQATLTSDDDRYEGYDLDGGDVAVGGGGAVAGEVSFAVDDLTVDGTFTAAHCANLDFIVPD